MTGDRLQLSRQARPRPALAQSPPRALLVAERLVGWYQEATAELPEPVSPGSAPPTQRHPPAAGATGYQQPRALALPILEYYQRGGSPQVGYQRPRTAPLPAVAPPMFDPEAYPDCLLADFPSHGQLLDAFAPAAFRRAYGLQPGAQAGSQFRRWLAPAFGTTSLSEPLHRFRHHALATDRSPAAVAQVEAYRRGVFEAMVGIFEEHPEYGAQDLS